MKKVLLDVKFWHICVQSINSLWFTLKCETVTNYCVIIMFKMASWSNDKFFQIFLSTSTKRTCNSSKILLHFFSVTTLFLHLLSLMFLNSFLVLLLLNWKFVAVSFLAFVSIVTLKRTDLSYCNQIKSFCRHVRKH